nr:hypothetical protein [Mucilaginibacter sp. X4EP1]
MPVMYKKPTARSTPVLILKIEISKSLITLRAPTINTKILGTDVKMR